MKQIFGSFSIILLLFCCNCTSTTNGSIIKINDLEASHDGMIHHFEYQKNNIIFEQGQELELNGDYNSSAELYHTYECKGEGCLNKYLALSDIYIDTEKYDSAWTYVKKAILVGASPSIFDGKYYSPLANKIQQNKDSLISMYQTSIDMELRQLINWMISQDQLNRSGTSQDSIDQMVQYMLDSLVEARGEWISQDMIGNRRFGSNPSIIVHHMNDTKRLQYIALMKQACLEGKENWMEVQSLVFQLMLRHPVTSTDFGYFNVDGLYFNHQGKLHPNRSSYMVSGIAQVLRDNPIFHLTIYPTKNLPEKLWLNALQTFKGALLAKGVSPDLVDFKTNEFTASHEYTDSTAFIIHTQRIE